MNELVIKKATRLNSYLKIGLAGASGSGKTYSALLMAYGLVGDWSKICVIDTENGSADLYSHLGGYNTLTLTAPFSPQRYVQALMLAVKAGMKVIIIDSITHEWNGEGGCLELVEQVTQASASKNSYTAWGKVTPLHNKFVQAILQCPAHVITTVRKTQDYEMTKDNNGKVKVEKAGLKDQTREGFEYELTLSLTLNMNHYAEVSKDRTNLFADTLSIMVNEDTGKMLKEWSESGATLTQKQAEKKVVAREEPKPESQKTAPVTTVAKPTETPAPASAPAKDSWKLQPITLKQREAVVKIAVQIKDIEDTDEAKSAFFAETESWNQGKASEYITNKGNGGYNNNKGQ